MCSNDKQTFYLLQIYSSNGGHILNICCQTNVVDKNWITCKMHNLIQQWFKIEAIWKHSRDLFCILSGINGLDHIEFCKEWRLRKNLEVFFVKKRTYMVEQDNILKWLNTPHGLNKCQCPLYDMGIWGYGIFGNHRLCFKSQSSAATFGWGWSVTDF